MELDRQWLPDEDQPLDVKRRLLRAAVAMGCSIAVKPADGAGYLVIVYGPDEPGG